MRHTRSSVLIITFLTLIGMFALAGIASATPLTNKFIDTEDVGLNIALGGVGLESLHTTGTSTLMMTVPVTVQQAILYWAGRDFDCPGGVNNCQTPFPYKDQVLIFDGNVITGTIIGTEPYKNKARNSVGYRYDVTTIVQAKGAGLQSFSIQDGEPGNDLDRLNGAGLLILYDDGTPDFYRVIVYDGLDFAYRKATGQENRTTAPVTFTYDPLSSARTAQMAILVGDAEAGREDQITISDNPDRTDTLDGSAGDSWDADLFDIIIPAGVGGTTVEVISPAGASNPDSLLWPMVALRLPTGGGTATAVRLASFSASSGAPSVWYTIALVGISALAISRGLRRYQNRKR